MNVLLQSHKTPGFINGSVKHEQNIPMDTQGQTGSALFLSKYTSGSAATLKM